MKIERFEDIEAWELARELTQNVYQLTRKDDFSRDYGLKDQIQKAAGSSMHNIAEGFDSETNAEFIRFLRYAKRSCSEVQSELYVALDESYITSDEFDKVYSWLKERVWQFVDLLTILQNMRVQKKVRRKFKVQRGIGSKVERFRGSEVERKEQNRQERG